MSDEELRAMAVRLGEGIRATSPDRRDGQLQLKREAASHRDREPLFVERQLPSGGPALGRCFMRRRRAESNPALSSHIPICISLLFVRGAAPGGPAANQIASLAWLLATRHDPQ